MTNKEKYIADIRSRHPGVSGEFLELCWVLHDYDKAKSYADILSACPTYTDIANRVIRPMYINGDIDDTRARSERFLGRLLPLACLDIPGNGHAAAYHVRQMLDTTDAREERRRIEARHREIWKAPQGTEAGKPTSPFSKITIEITDTESMELFIAFLRSAGTRFNVTESRHFHGPTTTGRTGVCIAIREAPRWLLEAFTDLRAHCPGASTWLYGFHSDWITRDGIALTEVLELIRQELS